MNPVSGDHRVERGMGRRCGEAFADTRLNVRHRYRVFPEPIIP